MCLPESLCRAQVANTAFNYALQQLSDLTYLWSTPTDLDFTNGTDAGYYNPGAVYLLNATNAAVCIYNAQDSATFLKIRGPVLSIFEESRI
jgi:hypothetical protein